MSDTASPFPMSIHNTHPSFSQLDFSATVKLTRALTLLSREQGVSLSSLLLTAFQVLLGRYCNSANVDVAVFTRLEQTTPVVLGNTVNGDTPFREQTRKTHTTLENISDKTDMSPGEEMPSMGQLQGLQGIHTTTTPVFSASFAMSDEERTPMTHANWRYLISGSADLCDLQLIIELSDSGKIDGKLLFRQDFFEADTVSFFAAHLKTLLNGIAVSPHELIALLPVISQEERDTILYKWNETDVPTPQDQCIHQLFEAQVERTPEAIALVFEDKSLRYCELNRRANQLAHYLLRLGVGPDVLVGICLERRLEMIIGLLGILKAGGAYVPLDPAYPRERLAFMLTDTQTPVLLTQAHLTGRLTRSNGLHVLCLDANREALSRESGANPVTETVSSNLAYVVYTSGSTGNPKGVAGHHKGTVNNVYWTWGAFPYVSQEVCCQITSLNFIDSVVEIFTPLLQGIQTIIISDEVVKNPPQLTQTLAIHRVTRIILVPSLLRAVLETCPDLRSRLPHLKTWFTGGEAVTAELVQRFQKSMPQCVLTNGYGSSEVSCDATWYEAGEVQSLSCVPIGRPISNIQAYILDPCLQPVPVGVPGELHIGGIGLARGYLNQPALTAEKFIANPFGTEPEARLYKTGDLTRYLPDGNIEFLGRIDHQVKIRGFRIELGEIERVLERHPAIRETVVIVREDVPGDKRLAAYVCFARNQTLSFGELRTALRQNLPSYMVPATFVLLDSLPLTPNGKVDRQALPTPAGTRPELETAFVTPRTPEEKTTARLWAEILNIDQVGIHDNFFELGGDSLLAAQILSLLHQTFQTTSPRLSLRSLFEAPTVAQFVSKIIT